MKRYWAGLAPEIKAARLAKLAAEVRHEDLYTSGYEDYELDYA
jgi:hypothetical protein